MDPVDFRSLVFEYIKTYNNFEVESMLSLMHPDVEFQNIASGKVDAVATGIDELRKLANQSRSMFSSRQQTVTGFKSAGNSVTIDVEFEGVLSVDLSKGMKAGEALRLKGRSEFEFRDGKFYRITDYS